MKRLFDILPADFLSRLQVNTVKPEIAYGVGREIVVKELADYFEVDDVEMSLDEETIQGKRPYPVCV